MVIYPDLAGPSGKAVVFGDESLISRNLDWNLKARDKCQWGIAPSIPADKWPVVTKRWFYVF